MVAYLHVVAEVYTIHQVVFIADAGGASCMGSTADNHVLADVVIITDNQHAVLSRIMEVLRFGTQNGIVTQPLFYRGANIARLKQAKAQEEQAKIQFQTALLNAGNEVSNALHLYQMEKDKAVSRTIQVNSARQAASDTKELFNLGTSTYLEVLSAEQSYLSAHQAYYFLHNR